MFQIIILMSTYNGQQYVAEQIESILNQKGVLVKLLVRDDGSCDGTKKIVKEYAKKYKNVTLIEGENVGFVNSFSELVYEGLNNEFKADYFAFADQDDIWLPSKLLNACVFLSKVDKGIPALYESNSMKVDAQKREIGLFLTKDLNKYSRGFSLINGSVQGCGMTFNRKAAEIYSTNPPHKSWHDRWMFLLCYFLGQTYYDPTVQFYYRIHGNNVLGNNNAKSFDYYKSQFRNFLKMPLHMEMAQEFFNNYKDRISEKDKKIFKIYLTYRYNIASKFSIMTSSNFMSPYDSLKGKWKYYWKLLLGRA